VSLCARGGVGLVRSLDTGIELVSLRARIGSGLVRSVLLEGICKIRIFYGRFCAAKFVGRSV
jgi:hypothetical protein